MARYKLMASEEQEPTDEVEEIDAKKLVELAVQRQIKHLLDNKIAVEGSVKSVKFNRKFQVTWQNAKTKLFHQQSYVAFVTDKGAIRAKGQGSAKVTQEEPVTAKATA